MGEALPAHGPAADGASGEFVGAGFAIDSLAVHALRGQIVGAGQMIVGAQE